MNYQDLIVRAVKTFLQSFLAVVTVGILAVDNLNALGTLLFAGLIGGLAGLFSFLQNWIKGTL